MLCKNANLQCLTGLQGLYLDIGFCRSSASSHHIKLLASILEEIPSSTLTTLYFDIPTPSTLLPRIREWHQIGKVLQEERFSQLTELVFIIKEQPFGRPRWLLERWIREDLYMFEEHGILSVR